MHNDIVRAIDAGDVSALVLLDLCAAFGTLEHGVLLDVLNLRFGIERSNTSLVPILSVQSHAIVLRCLWNIDSCNPPCSVPQGSVIGPYKFTAYTEDLVDIIEQFSINHHFYADDSQLQTNDRVEAAQPALMNFERCVCCQRLVFVNKIELIWFGSRANLKMLSHVESQARVEHYHAICDCSDLGVYLDN